MLVVPKGHYFGWACLFGVAMLCSVAVNVVLRLVFVVTQVPSSSGIWLCLLGTLIIIAAPMPVLYSRLRRQRVIGFAAIYALSVVLLGAVCEFSGDVYFGVTGEVLPLFSRGWGIPLYVSHSNLVVISLIGPLCAWLVCRWIRGPIVEQDGTLCPRCGYCLTGSVDRVCPECGRGFTFEDLGTTEEEFELKEAVRVRVARPIANVSGRSGVRPPADSQGNSGEQ